MLFKHSFQIILKKKIDRNYKQKKTLAICVGMQILFNKSEESNISGLNYFTGEVKSLKNLKCKDTIPHIGFNSIKISKKINLNFLKKRDFYFVHSFALNKIDLVKTNKEFIIGKTSHGNVDFISLILTTNLIATQFHPEKSGNSGIELFKYFYGKKRVIFKLIFKDDAFHLSRNFSLQRAGDTNWLFDKMNFQKFQIISTN